MFLSYFKSQKYKKKLIFAFSLSMRLKIIRYFFSETSFPFYVKYNDF